LQSAALLEQSGTLKLAELPMTLSYSLIVFLIVLGCAVGVGMGWGIWSLHHGRFATGASDEALRKPEQDQAIYMREVRLRQHQLLSGNTGQKYMPEC